MGIKCSFGDGEQVVKNMTGSKKKKYLILNFVLTTNCSVLID